jgi:hypothetical protein
MNPILSQYFSPVASVVDLDGIRIQMGSNPQHCFGSILGRALGGGGGGL